MSIWKTLGIEPTDDLRQIKKAYATKLKLCKPDESPREFQILHAAFERAVASNKRRKIAEMVTPPVSASERPLAKLVVDESVAASLTSVPPVDEDFGQAEQAIEQQAAVESYRQEEARLLEQVHQLLRQDYDTIHNKASWKFLEQSEYLLNSDFCWHIGLRLFVALDHHLCTAKFVYIRDGKPWPLMTHLESIFNWTGNFDHLQSAVGYDPCKRLFPLIGYAANTNRTDDAIFSVRGSAAIKRQNILESLRKSEIVKASTYKRLRATVMDVVLYFLACLLIRALCLLTFPNTHENTDKNVLVYIAAGYFIAVWLFECSKLQATPGMWFVGLKVTNESFRRIGFLQGLWRSLALAASLGLSWIAVILNNFLGGQLLHDRASNTYVVNYHETVRRTQES